MCSQTLLPGMRLRHHRYQLVIIIFIFKSLPSPSITFISTRLWLGFAETPRFMLGREALTLQCFPIGRLELGMMEDFGETFMFDLAGNAFAGSKIVDGEGLRQS